MAVSCGLHAWSDLRLCVVKYAKCLVGLPVKDCSHLQDLSQNQSLSVGQWALETPLFIARTETRGCSYMTLGLPDWTGVPT